MQRFGIFITICDTTKKLFDLKTITIFQEMCFKSYTLLAKIIILFSCLLVFRNRKYFILYLLIYLSEDLGEQSIEIGYTSNV